MLMTEKEKMLSGQLYDSFCPELVNERKNAFRLFSALNNSGKAPQAEREKILRELLGSCGAKAWVESPFYCDYGYNITLGENVFINFNCTILDATNVTIGSNVLIGPNVQLYAATHPTDWKIRASGLENAKPIKIGDNVWLGGGVVVCPGVTIGDRTTIGAASVVSKDIPADCVAAGNPCRVIKHLKP